MAPSWPLHRPTAATSSSCGGRGGPGLRPWVCPGLRPSRPGPGPAPTPGILSVHLSESMPGTIGPGRRPRRRRPPAGRLLGTTPTPRLGFQPCPVAAAPARPARRRGPRGVCSGPGPRVPPLGCAEAQVRRARRPEGRGPGVQFRACPVPVPVRALAPRSPAGPRTPLPSLVSPRRPAFFSPAPLAEGCRRRPADAAFRCRPRPLPRAGTPPTSTTDGAKLTPGPGPGPGRP